MAPEVTTRLEQLISKGGQVLATHRDPPSNVLTNQTLDSQAFSEWRAQSTAFLTSLLGADHVYSQRFAADVTGRSATDTKKGIGILQAVLEDAQLGLLQDIQQLLAAEVFADFLEMARHLVDEGYFVPAASLAGAVLEDGLRKIAAANAIPVKNRDDASSLNSRLAAKNVFNRLTQRRLQTAIEVRNLADHGKFDELTEPAVREMLGTVEAFLDGHITARA